MLHLLGEENRGATGLPRPAIVSLVNISLHDDLSRLSAIVAALIIRSRHLRSGRIRGGITHRRHLGRYRVSDSRCKKARTKSGEPRGVRIKNNNSIKAEYKIISNIRRNMNREQNFLNLENKKIATIRNKATGKNDVKLKIK